MRVLVDSRPNEANFVCFEAIQQVQFKNGELNARRRLTCVSSQMSLQGLLPGENSVADRALDAAGRLGALDDEGVDGVRPRPPSLRVAALQVRALARVTPSAAARAT